MPDGKFKLILSDIGGVLGTNGWDSNVRRTVCQHFDLVESEIADRHRLMFDSYERGYMTFEEYLRRVFFGSPRPFSIEQVRDLAYAQSVPWPENIAFFRKLKEANSIKVGLISNEGEGITAHRVETFRLRELADFMIVSHCVHMRKPDRNIWQLALDLTQVTAADTLYVDDRAMFVEIAAQMGFTAMQHVSLENTAEQFKKFGFITA
jgi:putative hydrolase of the HAD superfamily